VDVQLAAAREHELERADVEADVAEEGVAEDQPVAAAAVLDVVDALPHADDVEIVALPAGHAVVAGAGDELVAAVAAFERVIARLAEEHVVVRAAVDRVVADATLQLVAAGA